MFSRRKQKPDRALYPDSALYDRMDVSRKSGELLDAANLYIEALENNEKVSQSLTRGVPSAVNLFAVCLSNMRDSKNFQDEVTAQYIQRAEELGVKLDKQFYFKLTAERVRN